MSLCHAQPIIVHVQPDPIKTLIIDDDPTDRAIFKQYLEASGAGAFLFR